MHRGEEGSMGILHTNTAGASNKHHARNQEALRPAALLHRPLLAKYSIVPAGKGGTFAKIQFQYHIPAERKSSTFTISNTIMAVIYTHNTHVSK